MPENYSQYPRPKTPLSFKDVLSKALDDPEYASFIHGEVRRARTAKTEEERREAVANVDAHFMLSDEELTWLKLPAGFSRGKCYACTNTRPTHFLLDFATATPSWAPDEPGNS